jgi:(2Fe-2S) ferredoxin
MKFTEEIEERGLGGEVFVNNTGCFGICEQGPVIVVYPGGIWYKGVTVDDVETIMEEHIEGGNIVSWLEI